MFNKILIANRGEIAVRIIRSCRDLGISPVAVFSEADRQAMHVSMADEACCLGPAAANESYLRIDRILDAARRSGAEAVHPGYGFLSEKDAFAEACRDQGLVFIGPSVDSLRLMGDKVISRTAAREAGVPVVPGNLESLDSKTEALRLAAEMGYPVMLKASAGGGGKGMRLANHEQELVSLYDSAHGEALSSFGDPTLYLEKYLSRPRHIEIQILGDQQGNLVHLGERECSIQRRHQKLVEESPSPLLTPELREAMAQAALAVARTAGYYGAGTVEFLVESADPAQQAHFYFLEMNTRLQVEHTVTEMVTGMDLVAEQIRIASGASLGYQQHELQPRGHAIECRISAEDTRNGFLPSPGVLTSYMEPAGPGIRCDSGVCLGSSVPMEYDPLICKLLAHGQDREQAMARMVRALGEFKIAGVATTLPFFDLLLREPSFIQGQLHTHFIEEHRLLPRLEARDQDDPIVALIAAALHYRDGRPSSPSSEDRKTSRWKDLPAGWRQGGRWR